MFDSPFLFVVILVSQLLNGLLLAFAVNQLTYFKGLPEVDGVHIGFDCTWWFSGQ